MLYRKNSFFLLFIFFFLTLLKGNAQNNSLLWEISGNGLRYKSYLFGTIHLSDQRAFGFGDSVLVCFNTCKTMAGELVLEDVNKEALVNSMRMPGDTTLKMLLTKREYRQVKKYVRKNYGLLYVLAINKIKPIYTAILLSEKKPKQEEEDKKQEIKYSLDQYFQEVAKERNMKVTGLETVQEQLNALEIMSLKEQSQYLMQQIKIGNNEQEDLLEEMLGAYAAQNLDSLYHLFIVQSLPEEMMEALIYKRNQVMTERMEVLINENPTFVAVGAAHLPGKRGLIELLRKDGYTLRPVFCKK